MFVNDALFYVRERLFKLRIILLWLLLLGCILITADEPHTRLAWLVAASILFLVTFRLWDDIEDVAYDSNHFPQRYLVRVSDRRPFLIALGLLVLLLSGLLLYQEGSERSLIFLIFVTIFLIMYRVTANRPRLRPLRIVTVLAKYPFFVLVLSAHPGERMTLLAAMCAYLPPLLHETHSGGIKILYLGALQIGLPAIIWLIIMT